MAVVTGYSGMQMGDGMGGKISLAVRFGIIRFLENTFFAYKTAAFKSPTERVGSITYKLPEFVQTEKYNPGGINKQVINGKDITVPINIQRALAYETETFDRSRLNNWEVIVGMVAASVGTIIEADLNSHFWLKLKEQFDLTKGALRAQNLVLPNLQKENVTQDEAKAIITKLRWTYTQISKQYTKSQLGVKKSDLLLITCPEADGTFAEAFWGQPNALGTYVVKEGLEMTSLGGGVRYQIDNFLGQNIPKGIFRSDEDTDMSQFLGFIIHKEAIAFPWNIEKAKFFDNLDNLNEVFMVKYQFGFGILRPHLIYSITKTAPTRAKD